MTAATLTKPTETAREDGITGYAVTLHEQEETSNREPVEIVTSIRDGNMVLGIDREVELAVGAASTRICVYSERGIEMISHHLRMDKGDIVILRPITHPEPFGH